MSHVFNKILIVLISGFIISAVGNLGFNYYTTQIAPPDSELLKIIKNKYEPQFKSITDDYNHRLNLLAEEAKKAYHNLPANEPKTSLISTYLKKLNELDRSSDNRFKTIFEAYKKELRQNRLPLEPAWEEHSKYQAAKREKKEVLLKKYQSKLPQHQHLNIMTPIPNKDD